MSDYDAYNLGMSNPIDALFGYKIRNSLYDGEQSYFSQNPNVAGMASESGHIILNPYSPESVNKESVAKNEALRLLMRDKGITPEFTLTPEQVQQFQGTSYGDPANEHYLKQTIASRIYGGDPSAQATEEQKAWLDKFIKDYLKKAP